MNKTSKKFKDPGSAITHLIAMIGAVICAFPLIGKAVHTNNSIVVFAMSVFISSMILLYGASTLYHSLDISKKVNLFFRRIDHSMIFVLIAVPTHLSAYWHLIKSREFHCSFSYGLLRSSALL